MIYNDFLPPEFMAFLGKGSVTEGSKTVCNDFFRYVEQNYPLVPVMMDSVDWGKIPNAIKLEASKASEAEISAFIATTTVGKFSTIALIKNRRLPAFIMSRQFLVDEIDLITAMIPHTGYFVAVSEVNNTFRYNLDVFLEWELDSGMWLSGIRTLDTASD